ncbi:MAG TPA: Kiwa anti-phage protein KwaB-like domain-containing protein [Verrucomicrobiae bacterium]|nr:Kiwa anti-phage protein KwaB-like domain-containing protein [Verrucomicrobiae bacterium]
MNPTNDIFQYVNSLGGQDLRTDEITVQLLVMTKDKTLYRTNIDQNIEDGLIDSFARPICNYITLGPDEGLVKQEYDPQQTPEHPVLWTLKDSEVPAFESVKDQLSGSLDSLELFQNEEGNLDGVTALALRIQFNEQEMVVFQRLFPAHILKESRKFGLFFTGSNFGKLEHPTNFQVSRDNHVVYFGDTIHILHPGHFEALFDYETQKVAIASIKLGGIESRHAANIELEDGTTLESLLAGDKVALNKLQKLEDNNITLSQIKLQELKDSHDLDIELNTETGKMIIKNKRDAKSLISILNDDYLSSNLTSSNYAAQSKKKVQPRN